MDGFDLNSLIGKTLVQAKVILHESTMVIRILKKNGKQYPPSKEFKNNRINIHLKKDIIVEVFGVG